MDRGQIVFAPFLYSDLQGAKRRPACVVSSASFNAGPDVIVAMVTSSHSRMARPGVGDVTVERWREAGLHVPSVVRAGRLLVLEQRLIQFALGQLVSSDLDRVNAGLVDVLDLAR